MKTQRERLVKSPTGCIAKISAKDEKALKKILAKGCKVLKELK